MRTMLLFLCLLTAMSCKQRRKIYPNESATQSINNIIEKYNGEVNILPLVLNIKDKDLLTEILRDIYASDFNSELILEKIERSKKYYEDFSLKYYSIVDESKYRLDSIAIKGDYDKPKMALVEDVKTKLTIFEAQAVLARTESLSITSRCQELVKLRKTCKNSFTKYGLTFHDIECEDEFNRIVTDLNKHSEKMNEIINSNKNFK